MRKPLVAGNWKMNSPDESCTNLLNKMVEQAHFIESILKNMPNAGLEIALFPPSVYLKDTQEILSGSTLKWGSQNVSAYNEGAYTGEISAPMIKSFGCDYVLIGHSERRCLYEKLELDQYVLDQIVAEKYCRAVKNELTPIICMGESYEDYSAGKTEEIISRLLDVLIEERGIKELAKTVLAYEPVWAIGTGKSATPDWAQEVHSFIRQRIEKHDPETAESIRIIYGGSVKEDNASAIFAGPDIDGGLIGGASLDVDQFIQICFAAALKGGQVKP